MPCLTGAIDSQFPLWVCMSCGRSPQRSDRGRGRPNKVCPGCKKHLRLFIGPLAKGLRKMRFRTRGQLIKRGVWYLLLRARHAARS